MGIKQTTNSTFKEINLETAIEQGKTEQLIGYLENSNKVKGFNRYYSDKDEWDYYYSLTGFFKGDYFAITLYSCENKKTVRISPVTDCIDAIKELLKKFKIQPTEEWYSQEAERGITINQKQGTIEELPAEYKNVNRIEVINHSGAGEGREYVKRNISIDEFSLQDDGKTLKIFLK